MNLQQIEFYVESLKHELNQLNEKEFVGNISFKFNISKGSIANMQVELNKSIKMFDYIGGKNG